MMPAMPSMLYRGKVLHKRLRPFIHELCYSVFSIMVDIDRLEELDQRLRCFSYNRRGLISLYDKDYGCREGRPLRLWVNDMLAEKGLPDLLDQPVRLLTFPRLWGYSFNPLSIYYCYCRKGDLRAVIYEVSNTFGESQAYVLPVSRQPAPRQGNHPESIHHGTDKIFHVSPFIEMDCHYKISLRPPDERMCVVINQSDSTGKPMLVAKHDAQGVPLSDAAIIKAVLGDPLMTFKVIVGIHWEALKLWLKGARFYKSPDYKTFGQNRPLSNPPNPLETTVK
jgi:DUF1365 family protein